VTTNGATDADSPLEKGKAPVAHIFSPAGIAGFASAPLGRLCWAQIPVALLSALLIAWATHAGLYPLFAELIHQLPEAGEIRNGQLVILDADLHPRARNSWLYLAIEPDADSPTPRALKADLQVVAGSRSLAVCSWTGCLHFDYPKGIRIPLNAGESRPWWGAWRWVILGLLLFGTFVGLILSWWGLASICFVIPLILAWLGRRRPGCIGAWKMHAASLLPAAILADIAIVGLLMEWIDPASAVAVFILHFPVPLVLLSLAVAKLKPSPVKAVSNPFQSSAADHKASKPRKASENPFAATPSGEP